MDVKTKPEIIQEAIELEKREQKMESFGEKFEDEFGERDIRNLTKEVFDDLMKNLSIATDT